MSMLGESADLLPYAPNTTAPSSATTYSSKCLANSGNNSNGTRSQIAYTHRNLIGGNQPHALATQNRCADPGNLRIAS